MSSKKQISNLDKLEKEIFRQKLMAKEKERELERNFEDLQEHFPSYLSASVFGCNRKKSTEHKSFIGSFFENEHVHSFVSGVADKAANKTGEFLEKLLEKIFRK